MTRARRAAWWTALLAVGCAAALWRLPARWVMAWIPASSPIVVVDATGTLWEARANLALGAPGLRRSLPGAAHWRVTFDGGPGLVLAHPWLRGPVRLDPTWRGLRLSAQSLQLPASALTTLHAVFNALDPGGEVLLEWPELLLRPGRVTGSGSGALRIQWRNASSSLSRVRPLGDYALSLNLTGEGEPVLALETLRGLLHMEGAGVLQRGGRAHFDGRAWVEPLAPRETREALRPVLDALGPSAGSGGGVVLRMR
ncbi:type II secretion system protein N [Castellaniella sp. GW247-6E4]|uniref:type II secretion system protein N n=1 Tax=Castellaniella sp. GW247-6E4 TaxID=3140380 RepID=UPI003314CFCC